MSLVRNERTKLTATYLNGLGIALFAVGGLAPLFSTLYASAGSAQPLWVDRNCQRDLLHLQRGPTCGREVHSRKADSMTPLEFLALFSIVPVGALVIAAIMIAVVRRDQRRSDPPGE